MKVLLIKDVYKLGRAGDVKRVANGYGRNYLIPQGMAVLATEGALKQVEQIRVRADSLRDEQNQEMSGIARQLEALVLTFPAKAGETGKLYGSVTSQMISDELKEKLDLDLDRRMLDMEPIRTIGSHKVHARLTVDLIPDVTVIVYREGESPEAALEEEALMTASEEDTVEDSEDATSLYEAVIEEDSLETSEEENASAEDKASDEADES